MENKVYIVWNSCYQEDAIDKIFTKEEVAKEYAEQQNKKWNTKTRWYVSEEDLYE